MWSCTLAFCAGLVASRKEAGAFWHSPSLAPAWGSSGARAVQVSSMFAMGPQQMLGTQNSIQNFMSSVGAEIITTGAAGAVAVGATVGSGPFDAVVAIARGCRCGGRRMGWTWELCVCMG